MSNSTRRHTPRQKIAHYKYTSPGKLKSLQKGTKREGKRNEKKEKEKEKSFPQIYNQLAEEVAAAALGFLTIKTGHFMFCAQ